MRTAKCGTEWKGRIGVIYPSDGMLDAEFWRCVPPTVSVHVTRSLATLDLEPGLSSTEQIERLAASEDLDLAAGTFSLIGPACVAYACTSASFARGVGFDSEIVSRIAAASGAPATTTSTAVVAALRELGVGRIAVAAPYEDQVCDRLRAFFQDSGFEIVSLTNLGMDFAGIGDVPVQ